MKTLKVKLSGIKTLKMKKLKVKISKQQAIEFVKMLHFLSESFEELSSFLDEKLNVLSNSLLNKMVHKYIGKLEVIRNAKKYYTLNLEDHEAILLSIIYQSKFISNTYRLNILMEIFNSYNKHTVDSQPMLIQHLPNSFKKLSNDKQ